MEDLQNKRLLVASLSDTMSLRTNEILNDTKMYSDR